MRTVSVSEFKREMVLLLDGLPHVIEDFHASAAAQAKHRPHARLRNLKTGRVLDRLFAEHERVPVADLEYRRLQYSYPKGATYYFIDTQSFEEFELSSEQLGERHWYLKADEECKALVLDGKLLDIVLPGQVALRVADTAPATSGGADSAWKSAQLETGLEIMVPLFIEKDETVRVDTQTRKYIGKESGL